MSQALDAAAGATAVAVEALDVAFREPSMRESGELGLDFEVGGSFVEKTVPEPDATGEKREGREKLSGFRYSTKEILEMRSRGVAEQRRLWEEVYGALGEVIARDYDGLREVSGRKQKRGGKKKEAKASLFVADDSAVVNTSESTHVLDVSEILENDANVSSQNDQAVGEWFTEFEGAKNVDDSSDDEIGSIQKPAFLVEGEPDFDSGPPLDGMEYLRRVKWEAAQIPKIKVAKLESSKQSSERTPYMPKLPEIEKCPPNLLPSKIWEDVFLSEYSELKQAFSQLEDSCNQLPARNQDENSRSDPDCMDKPKSSPTASFLLSMDPVSRASKLRNRISLLESASELSRDECLWLFALSVAVDTPLDADMCASMRCLLRKCSSFLARKAEPDDETAMLNILIAIAGKYFRQSEN
ncbi:uncharacterized protein LOC141845460 [Curcuma longa]|uniref:uncharacterized protein LOC141845460 n=1 Tax=Curcuma longa TaxID=136217 RepID=UPI003D9EC539